MCATIWKIEAKDVHNNLDKKKDDVTQLKRDITELTRSLAESEESRTKQGDTIGELTLLHRTSKATQLEVEQGCDTIKELQEVVEMECCMQGA